jgi:hypothetical protein
VSRATNDEAPAVAAAQAFRDVQELSPDLPCCSESALAALTIEGEAYARAYLDRLQRGTVSTDDLAVLMAFLRGEMLAGACRVIEKALGARHA